MVLWILAAPLQIQTGYGADADREISIKAAYLASYSTFDLITLTVDTAYADDD